MRYPKYLSYSSFGLWEKNPAEFYIKYMADKKLPREPQNHYMAVGSSFDAYAKAHLYKLLVDKGDPQFEFQTLFETQVEPHNRTQALADGLKVFNAYCKVGAMQDLINDLKGCIGEPSFESTIEGDIGEGINILGKPDVRYVNREGCRVVHDFKVNGFYSNTPPSPKTGFMKMFPGGAMHKNACPVKHKGMVINAAAPMDMANKDWAEQLSMYAWVMGEPVGSDYILSVDQLCCNKGTGEIRVAKHIATCNTAWQVKFFERLRKAWVSIKNGHIFQELTYEANLAKIQTLDMEINLVPDAAFDSVLPQRIR